MYPFSDVPKKKKKKAIVFFCPEAFFDEHLKNDPRNIFKF